LPRHGQPGTMICIHTECPATSSNPPSRMERCAVTMRVLVADDDVVFRAGLASLLAGNPAMGSMSFAVQVPDPGQSSSSARAKDQR